MDQDIAPEETPTEPADPVRLWLPRDVLIASIVLGFPGGFGLVARNAWRIGRRSTARLILLIGLGVAAAYFFVLPDDLPRNILLALNAGAAGGLYSYSRGQQHVVEDAGQPLLRASARSGIATFIGGWLVTAGPSILLALVLSYGGSANPAAAGSIVFGTGGSECDVRNTASIATGDRMSWVAHLSREVRAGDVLHITQSAPGLPDAPREFVVDGSATCIRMDGFAFAGPSETITVEVTLGSERLAYGQVTLAK